MDISWCWKQYFGVFSILISLILVNYQAKSQINDSISAISADTVGVLSPTDTIPNIASDTIPIDSIAADSVKTTPVGDITTTVLYKSRDSIYMNMQTTQVNLYGESSIDYQPIGLDAEEIEINWGQNIIDAHGVPDSSGVEVGKPVFRSGGEQYETNNIRYNFKTEKAVISGLVTKQGEGIIHGEAVYKNEKDELYIPHTKYTTCNLAHPHFYIAARDVKAIPGNKLVTGPFNMVVNEVPTPLGFFFGMFPEQNQRASGLIIPSYGEQNLKGFYLEDGGYFLALSDYMNLALTGSVYSKGGYGVNVRSRYIKRYKYTGNFTFNLTKQNFSNDAEANESQVTDFRLNWSHSPQTKGTGRFSASVNAATSTFNQNNVLQDMDQQINATLSSSVSYNKSFTGTPISMGINTRFNQNVQTKKVDLLLPEVSMNVQSLYPFQSKTGGGSKNWLNRLTLRYTFNALNQITNQISSDSIAPFDFNTLPKLVENARNGAKHTIPIGTSLKAFKYFTVSPSANYQELWYSSKLDYTYDPDNGTITTDTIPGFNRVFSYNAGVGMNTRMYGTYFFNREYGIQAIRHVLNPSISYSYRPDFSDPKFDYYQEVQSDENGNTISKRRYQGYIYGQPGAGESSALSFSLSNTLEMKSRSKKDTTGKAEKVALLRNFGLSSSYNFAVDSFNMSNIAVRATTTLLNNKEVFGGSATMQSTNINLTGSVDPYVWELDSIANPETDNSIFYQRRINKFAWNNGDGLGKFSVMTFNLRTGIRSKARDKGSSELGSYQSSEMDQMQQRLTDPNLSYHEQILIENILDNPQYFVDFNVPWSLSITYTVNYRRRGHEQGEITQSMRFNGDLSLSPKWKLTYNSGYDFVKKELTTTRIGLFRDLHCWELNFSWVPFGRFTSYDFSIRAKSSLLQDLKLNRRRSFTDNLF